MTPAAPIPAEFEERHEVASTDLEKVAERARRNLRFQVRLWPEPRTTPEQLQAAIERGRAALRRRAQ
jgi:hypothetical protein